MSFDKLLTKVFGSSNQRFLKTVQPIVEQINALEPEIKKLSDEQLRARTAEFKERVQREVAAITDKEELKRREREVLDEILPEAFAVVREASVRTTGMRHFDVQLIGGIVLHQGKIAEMRTGEGKTLVATLPAYLNALTGRGGVHVITVNDYLASRDAEWMGQIHRFLGLEVGCIQNDMDDFERQAAYAADITYGTNNEFGFDYLRDNMKFDLTTCVQRGHYYAIVDEVDSILIDEARTPLIISGPSVMNVDHDVYNRFKPTVENLVRNQERLCARFLSEAEQLMKKLRPEDDSKVENADALEREIGLLLYRVKLGNPRSEALLRLLEDPENLRLMNTAELQLHADQSKKDLYAQKEELFYAMDEKSHDADLTEKGRGRLRPNDPEAFVLPDMTVKFHEIDSRTDVDPRQRMELKSQAQKEFEQKALQIHLISQLLKAYSLYQNDVHYVIENGKVVIVDEHTGRPMYGRRWSDGLHQAVEAKEGVEI